MILNCNNIRKLTKTKEDILESIKESSVLEVNEEKSGIRRKANKPIPELKAQKRKRPDENNEEEKGSDLNYKENDFLDP